MAVFSNIALIYNFCPEYHVCHFFVKVYTQEYRLMTYVTEKILNLFYFVKFFYITIHKGLSGTVLHKSTSLHTFIN